MAARRISRRHHIKIENDNDEDPPPLPPPMICDAAAAATPLPPPSTTSSSSFPCVHVVVVTSNYKDKVITFVARGMVDKPFYEFIGRLQPGDTYHAAQHKLTLPPYPKSTNRACKEVMGGGSPHAWWYAGWIPAELLRKERKVYDAKTFTVSIDPRFLKRDTPMPLHAYRGMHAHPSFRNYEQTPVGGGALVVEEKIGRIPEVLPMGIFMDEANGEDNDEYSTPDEHPASVAANGAAAAGIWDKQRAQRSRVGSSGEMSMFEIRDSLRYRLSLFKWWVRQGGYNGLHCGNIPPAYRDFVFLQSATMVRLDACGFVLLVHACRSRLELIERNAGRLVGAPTGRVRPAYTPGVLWRFEVWLFRLRMKTCLSKSDVWRRHLARYLPNSYQRIHADTVKMWVVESKDPASDHLYAAIDRLVAKSSTPVLHRCRWEIHRKNIKSKLLWQGYVYEADTYEPDIFALLDASVNHCYSMSARHLATASISVRPPPPTAGPTGSLEDDDVDWDDIADALDDEGLLDAPLPLQATRDVRTGHSFWHPAVVNAITASLQYLRRNELFAGPEGKYAIGLPPAQIEDIAKHGRMPSCMANLHKRWIPYKFRYTYASYMLFSGVPLHQILLDQKPFFMKHWIARGKEATREWDAHELNMETIQKTGVFRNPSKRTGCGTLVAWKLCKWSTHQPPPNRLMKRTVVLPAGDSRKLCAAACGLPPSSYSDPDHPFSPFTRAILLHGKK